MLPLKSNQVPQSELKRRDGLKAKYARDMNLPVPSLADQRGLEKSYGPDEARESDSDERNTLPVTPAAQNRPRGGQKFDRKKYMREYMKKHREKPKTCPRCGEKI